MVLILYTKYLYFLYKFSQSSDHLTPQTSRRYYIRYLRPRMKFVSAAVESSRIVIPTCLSIFYHLSIYRLLKWNYNRHK
jgi:hypothetical protein